MSQCRLVKFWYNSFAVVNRHVNTTLAASADYTAARLIIQFSSDLLLFTDSSSIWRQMMIIIILMSSSTFKRPDWWMRWSLYVYNSLSELRINSWRWCITVYMRRLLGTWLTTVRLSLTLPLGAIYVPPVVVT